MNTVCSIFFSGKITDSEGSVLSYDSDKTHLIQTGASDKERQKLASSSAQDTDFNLVRLHGFKTLFEEIQEEKERDDETRQVNIGR